MKRNYSPDFVGLEELKRRQREQLYNFECWAASGKWNEFHRRHYDRWMLPDSQPNPYGEAYTIYDYEVNQLKKDSKFVHRYLRGVELLLLSWGWRLRERKMVDNPEQFQAWSDRPVRLYRCVSSLLLFGCEKEFNSVRTYTLRLISEGKNFWYDGSDYAELLSKYP